MDRRLILPLVVAAGLATLLYSMAGMASEQSAPAGTITTVAGTGQVGYFGDGGPATRARLNHPFGVAVDATGNLYFADNTNNRIRKVSPDGIITTVAGNGKAGLTGDGGPATEARLEYPIGLALDQAGNLYFSQSHYDRVRKVSPDGIISTVAGSGPIGIDLPSTLSGDGGPATAAHLDSPIGLAVDAQGNLLIAEYHNQRIRKVSPDGIITTVAGSGPFGPGQGAYTGDGGPATQARLNGPGGLAVDEAGNLFFTEIGNDVGGGDAAARGAYRVRKVSAEGIISTVAGIGVAGFSGDGGLATEARLNLPGDVAVDSAGNLFIADWGNYRVREVDRAGIISTVAGTGRNRYAGDGVPATATGLRGPEELAVDAAGNLLISDSEAERDDGLGPNERILKVFGVAAPGLTAGAPFPASR